MTDFKKTRLNVNNGPDIHFQGHVLAEYNTQAADGRKVRWTELRLWGTPAGNWVAEAVGKSSDERERDLRSACVIERPHDDEQASRLAAMQLWGWSPAAKALAAELGWDVIRRVA